MCCKVQYIVSMSDEKTIRLSFQVAMKTKRLLYAATQHEHRSLTNMLEVLVEGFCARNNIEDPEGMPLRGIKRGGRANG
ncbi:hypothetical protein EDC26_101398 [Paralcaligenes ureilyticus]|uniref:Uncharacterized protein n=1 Tax=Paralcaligenes ureilyticus TaxID=627131 RepID=A0A4R3MC86_9BURK|nr:hypothetical protein EDC26_101398 [Paralcaligenes ureilyticus]